ncbi:tyrosine-type recombinase/integrase [Natrinema sp. DC36]|uniref:tyrosine-type recombinase/integrase n=1 Tax=Natrinema sp. DC36 TaxID=2878680 RepID=UPI001CF06237|nr:tyrosine-type recombinase/integrase [Natrinema sp. DC36]
MARDRLEPISPEEAQTLYLQDKKREAAPSTIQSQEYRLNHFIRWCESEEIKNLNGLTGREIQQYRNWRREDGDLSPASEKTQMDTLRVFIKYLESIEGVPRDLHQSVQSPTLSDEDRSRDVFIDSETAEEILGYLNKFNYAQRHHVAFMVMWRCSLRISAVQSLDVSDYNREKQCLTIEHRPDEGTRLKKGQKGERVVGLKDDSCEVLDDWLEHHRADITDEYGREPLVTTTQGRMHKTTLRNVIYNLTRPCKYTNECPHEDVDPDECRATSYDYAYECPSSVSPHAIRRSAITHWLNRDWPTRAVADRANVSPKVLERHYDARDQEEKMEQRREFLDNL